MLAQAGTSPAYIAVSIATLVLLFIPLYVMSLKAANGYGKLEQKVDNLALMQAQSSAQHEESVKLLAATMDKLADKFNEHAIQDAGHFGELRGMVSTSMYPAAQSPVPQQKG